MRTQVAPDSSHAEAEKEKAEALLDEAGTRFQQKQAKATEANDAEEAVRRQLQENSEARPQAEEVEDELGT